MPTFAVWVALGKNGNWDVGTDEDTALERLIDGSDEDLTGTACRLVKLSVTMADPHETDDDDDDDEEDDDEEDDDDDETDKVVNVAVPDDAGRIVEVEMEE